MRLRGMLWNASIFWATFMLTVTAGSGTETNLVARWDFDEGAGDVLRDFSGNGNHGKIHGARWIKSGNGHALQFNGVNDYVDCGNGPSLDLTTSLTLEVWAHPDAPTTSEPGILGKFYDSYLITYYKDGSSYFYIGGPGDNGVPASIKIGQWSHLAAVFDGNQLRFFVNGREISSGPSKYNRARPGGNLMIGGKIGDPSRIDEALRSSGFFAGQIDAARVYNRAMTAAEIVEHFNQEAMGKGLRPIDTALFGKLWITPFIYDDRAKAVLHVDYQWVKPLPSGAQVRVELFRAGESDAINSVTLKPDGPRDFVEATFSTAGLSEGRYRLCASLQVATGQVSQQAESVFSLPTSPLALPSPQAKRVPPLPARVEPPRYRFNLSKHGGFTVFIEGQPYQVESSFSFPHGGDNGLTVDAAEGCEDGWKVTTRKLDRATYHARAEGSHYAIDRQIKLTPTRIEVADTITNKTADVLGIIFSHQLNLRGQDDVRRTLLPNPTVFCSRRDSGIGLIPLDDAYFLQQRTINQPDRVAIVDEHFGLDKGAAYTVRWAAYPIGTADYFDFINQFRADENIGGHVKGTVELTSRWGPPPSDMVQLKAIKYPSVASLTHLQNPPVSLEGWEFMEYPELCARIKKAIAETRQIYRGMQPCFHVAHSLFATDKPDQLFPDSRAIEENGSQLLYGVNTMDYYGRYFDRELVEKNWRWWTFYPTLENSFGKYMLRAADYMIHELGAPAIWADGFIGGYVPGKYTYDHWDGHSVTIDPKTKTVTRKKANVTLVALPVLKAVARKFSDNGGVLIYNDLAGPPSFWEEKVISSNETGGSDQQPIASLHLAQTVTPLGNPTVIKCERDVYLDILNKLDLGALYFYYGERDFVKEPTIVSHMYPITFESIHAGTVRGKERIVTKNSGVYGWPGDRQLHAVHLSDARGRLVPNRFVTTVDSAGARTGLTLGENESAIVARIPVRLDAAKPINVIVRQYDANGIELALNGKGRAVVVFRDGLFPVHSHAAYRIETDPPQTITADRNGTLSVPLRLNGEARLRIGPANPPAERTTDRRIE